MVDRRIFLVGLAGLGLGGCTSGGFGTLLTPDVLTAENEPYPVAPVNMATIPAQFHRREIADPTGRSPGTIVIDPSQRYLYLVEDGGRAIRYGVGVGRQGFAWSGEATVQRKAKWPTWYPPKEMQARDERARAYADGMKGGPQNPLGARAMYLYQDGRDTLYRIHGTTEPQSIGKAMSSGCIRMLNADVIDLYNRAPISTRVVVIPAMSPFARIGEAMPDSVTNLPRRLGNLLNGRPA